MGGLLRGGGFDAVLLPRDRRDPRYTAKVVDGDTAALLAGLERPGRLPRGLTSRPTAEVAPAVASLVLDGVLEIESEEGFVGGVRAHRLLVGERPSAPVGGRLGRLSLEALRYAESLPFDDVRRLARRLYSYNRIPCHRRWLERFGGSIGTLEALGLGSHDPLAARLVERYEESEHAGWHSWSRDSRAMEAPERLRAKLYVSPHPEALAPALRAALELLVEREAPAFKVGRTVFDLLRPDKFVAYFESLEELEAVARELAPRLRGLRAQGVPFTAELTEDGMLSWGIDPPQDAALQEWRGLESWRLWISNQLALSLRLARAQREGPAGVEPSERDLEPWRFALDHLRLQGVDPATWSPVGTGDGLEVRSW